MTPVTLDTWLRYQNRDTWNDTQHSAPELHPSVKDASQSEDPGPLDSGRLPSSGWPRGALAAGEPLPCLAVQPPLRKVAGAPASPTPTACARPLTRVGQPGG